MSDFSSFVRRCDIKQKRCSRYVKDRNNSHNRCHCGNNKEDHVICIKAGFDLLDSQDIVTYPCETFGQLRMDRLRRTALPYICLSDDTHEDVVWELLTKQWKLNVPNLVITVVGQKFTLQREQKTIFQNGLLKAAKNTDMWIITDGLATGTAELIGEAVKNHNSSTFDSKIVTIGIAPWGKVANRDSLHGSANQPTVYLKNRRDVSALAQHHTHFILVDDGTVNQTGKANIIREKIVQKLREKNIYSMLLVVGGDETLCAVLHASKNKIPLMVIKGTGMAADLTKALKTSDEVSDRGELRNQREVQSTVSETMAQIVENSKITGQRPCISTIHEHIDKTIIQTALKAFASHNEKVKFAVQWNCFENAEKIMTNVEEVDEQILFDAMIKGLLEDNSTFVDFLFKEENLNLTKFLTYERLRKLYTDVEDSAKGTNVSILLCKLLNTQQTSLKAVSSLLYYIGQLVSNILKNVVGNPYEVCRDETNDGTFEYPEKELFLWTILTQRTNIADMVFRLGDNQLLKALAASAIFAFFVYHPVFTDSDEDKQFYTLSMQYENFAKNVLGECYNRDKGKAHMLLIKEADLFNKTPTTVFRLANYCLMTHFMRTDCCQTKLTTVWMGNMDKETSLSKIFLSILMLPLILTVQFHEVEENQYVGCCGGNKINPLSAMRHFNTAPITIMFHNIISFFVYIGIFSYFVLSKLYPIDHPDALNIVEWVLIAWTGILACETIRTILNQEQIFVRCRFYCWLKMKGNWWELIMYILFITSVLCRFFITESFVWVRFSYCMTLSLCYMKFMSNFRFIRDLGSQVIMIRYMLSDKNLWFFFLLLMLFTINFGITYHALLYPATPFSWKLIVDVIYMPYWQLFGELFLDEIGEDQTSCSTKDNLETGMQCSQYSPLVILTSATYMVLTNIILLNLFIAFFTTKFGKAQENAEYAWKFSRYRIVHMYYNTPVVCTPFVFLSYIYRIGKWLYMRCKGQQMEKNTEFFIKMSDEENNTLCLFEDAAAQSVFLDLQKSVSSN